MCGTKKRCTCSLVLEDGTVFTGESFGAKIPVDGEVGKLVQYFVVFLFKRYQYCGSPCSGGGTTFVQLVPFHGKRRLVVTSKHPSTWILS